MKTTTALLTSFQHRMNKNNRQVMPAGDKQRAKHIKTLQTKAVPHKTPRSQANILQCSMHAESDTYFRRDIASDARDDARERVKITFGSVFFTRDSTLLPTLIGDCTQNAQTPEFSYPITDTAK